MYTARLIYQSPSQLLKSNQDNREKFTFKGEVYTLKGELIIKQGELDG